MSDAMKPDGRFVFPISGNGSVTINPGNGLQSDSMKEVGAIVQTIIDALLSYEAESCTETAAHEEIDPE